MASRDRRPSPMFEAGNATPRFTCKWSRPGRIEGLPSPEAHDCAATLSGVIDVLRAILLTLLACIATYDALGTKTFALYRPLLAGTLAGVIVGDVHLGMAIGATLELIALGVYT